MLNLPGFAYFEPETIEEACSLLSQYNGKARILAGGTDLLVKMKQGIEKPQYLVSLKSIARLSDIEYDAKDGLRIGALASLSDVTSSSIVNQMFGIVSEAARTVASRQIRNRGTVGGNLCNASPAADTAPALVGLGSQVKIAGLTGERVIPLEEFFVGPGQTVLGSNEILAGIQVPNPSPHTWGTYLKLSRRLKDLATVAVAAVIVFDSERKVCEDARIVLGAVAPTVIRSPQAEGILKGIVIGEDVIEKSAEAASEAARPITDVRGSAEYRREMVKVLTKRAIRQVLEMAKSS